MRTIVALLLIVLAGCVGTVSSPSASSAAETAAIDVDGVLSHKGPDIGGWWGVTDGNGQLWRLVDIPPALQSKLPEWQYRHVTVRAIPAGKSLFTLIRPVRITAE